MPRFNNLKNTTAVKEVVLQALLDGWTRAELFETIDEFIVTIHEATEEGKSDAE